jgi:DNA helicase HerA-like ATPase
MAEAADITPSSASSPGSSPAGADPTAAERIAAGYAFTGTALELGTVVLNDTAYPDARIRIPLGMLNRHGLIAGATGTGKTKTL